MNLGPNFTTTSTDCFKSGEGGPGQFPAGLRVLVVDDDLTCLKILEKMLLNCHYEVTKSSRAEVGLKLLRDNKDGYDIVLSDVHMPDMDGFKLLECVGLEMDLPVIMMSADDSKDVVMKGIIHGACDYLIKPIRMEALKNIWQHVVRRKQQVLKEREFEHSGSEDGERVQRPTEGADCTSSANEGNWKGASKKRKEEEEEEEVEERDDTSALKKPRVVWSVELHQQFVNAVNQLGIDKAVPKKILELMNVPGLTRENVASHLQKYRLYLRRLNLPQPAGIGNTFLGNPDAPFGTLSPLHGISVQTLMDQRNIFNFENPKIRFMNGQSQNNSNKQTNLLHGIPTNMDSKQLAALHQSGQSFGNTNMHIPSQSNQSSLMMPQMVQPQLRTQLLNKINSGHVLNLQSSLPSGIPNAMLVGSGFGNSHLPSYSSVSLPSNTVDFSRGQRLDLSGNTFSSMGNSARNVAFTCRGTAEQEMSSEPKGGSRGGLGANYDALNELKRNRTDELDQRTVGTSFETHQQPNLQVRMDVPPVVVQPTPSPKAKTRISSSNYHITPSIADGSSSSSSSRIKAESFPVMGFQNDSFNDQLESYDLMSALLKQQSEDILPGEHEYNLDGFSLDNHPV